MKKISIWLPILAVVFVCVCGCTVHFSVTRSRDVKQVGWIVESESSDCNVDFRADTVEIRTPKGFTLWWPERISGPVRIEYDAQIVMRDSLDRLSDLNCFWMATDPAVPDGNVFSRMGERSGIFVRCYSLALYYVGFGGNSNRTTRFRRYDGDERGVTDGHHRPAILREYTDADHLLRPNHWYHVVIECDAQGRTTYQIDGERLVDFADENPYKSGWFGFRTTKSHARLAGFKVSHL